GAFGWLRRHGLAGEIGQRNRARARLEHAHEGAAVGKRMWTQIGERVAVISADNRAGFATPLHRTFRVSAAPAVKSGALRGERRPSRGGSRARNRFRARLSR